MSEIGDRYLMYEATEDFESCGRHIKKGQRLWPFGGCTYGCISDAGEAVSYEEDKNPFFEVPKDKIKEVWIPNEAKP